MKIFNKSSVKTAASAFAKACLVVMLLSTYQATPASAHVNPSGCSGSGLGINMFTNLAVANIGDTINYSLVVFNGAGGSPVVCDATNIQASLVTPDGVIHSISLVRTSLSNGEFDVYPNVVSYIANMADITPQGTLAATASDTGVIHQNITDSQGGGNQGLNVFILNSLHVVKVVVNDDGGVGTVADFNIHVKDEGSDVSGSPTVGTAVPGTAYQLIAGSYNVSEDANILYSQSFSGDCDEDGNVAVLAGDNKTCTITNDDIPTASIEVIKVVVNDNGGIKTVGDFPLFVASTTVTSGEVNIFPAPATYIVTETADLTYTRTFSGDCDANGNISLVPGDNKTCTITNDDIPSASINVVKVVVNDNGGTNVIADFPLFVNGNPVVSGVTSILPAPASYVVSETSNSNYTQSISGDCDANGNVSLVPGENKTCVITNDDIAPPVVTPPTGGGGGGGPPPLIDVVKVPDPLALPGGPGLVTYTYTLRNVGTVSVGSITMVGDTCSPIVYVSGDTDTDSRLDVEEVWVFRCSTTLSVTHTNVVTATGWANGNSTSDVASATVVVGGGPGLPNTGLVPPLIHVTKIPYPLSLIIGGGIVTYSNRVTNPGTVALSNVVLNDDKCGAVQYISGDSDGDSMLDTSETWLYACSMRLSRTTTNTVIAEGTANGMTARDLAIATVVVSVPRLPNTAVGFGNTSMSWLVILGMFGAGAALSYVALGKRAQPK